MSNYSRFYDYIDEPISVAFEVGTRDCLDAIDISNKFNCKVFAFEANSDLFLECEENIKKSGTEKVFLVKEAISDISGEDCVFTYPVNFPGPRHTWIGCGGLAGKVTEEYWSETSHAYKDENLKWDNKIVKTKTLFDFCEEQGIENIDLLCLDVEGIPLKCIKGLGDKIKNVNYIISEVSYSRIHETIDDLYDDMNIYLESKGFSLIDNDKTNNIHGNAIWKRTCV